jgi:hypothetical protein
MEARGIRRGESELDEADRQARARPAGDADDDLPARHDLAARHGRESIRGDATGIWTGAKSL